MIARKMIREGGVALAIIGAIAVGVWLKPWPVGSVAAGYDEAPPNPPGLIAVGAEAPDFKLKDAADKGHELQALRDKKIAVLDFNSVTCPVSTATASAHARIFEKVKDKADEIAFWGLYPNAADADALKDYGEERGLKYPLLLDEGAKTKRAFGVQKTPSTVLVGRDGKVLAVHNGWNDQTEALLAEQIEAALAGEPMPKPLPRVQPGRG